jgi:DnaJ-class molecular chaperone
MSEWMVCNNCLGTCEIAEGVTCPTCHGEGGWDVPDADEEDTDG